MINEFSPLMRKVLAIGILIVVIFTAMGLIVVPLYERVNDSRETLANSRFEVARLENIIKRPSPPVGEILDPRLLIRANNEEDAKNTLQNLILSLAASNELEATVVFSGANQPVAGLLSADIVVLGDEISISNFLAQIENDQILMRLVNWDIEYNDNNPDQLRTNFRAIAVWEEG